MPAVLNLLTLAILSLAAYTDLTRRRIPNLLTLPAAVVGLLLHLAWRGPEGLASSALGWLAGVGLLLVPFLFRGIGAGDVKLLAAVGALQGAPFALAACGLSFLFGGLFAMAMLRHSGALGLAIGSLFHFRFLPRPLGHLAAAGRLPYAPALALGALAAFALGAA